MTGDVPVSSIPIEVSALPWVAGSRILSAALNVAVRTKVLTTVVWFPAGNYTPWSNEWGKR